MSTQIIIGERDEFGAQAAVLQKPPNSFCSVNAHSVNSLSGVPPPNDRIRADKGLSHTEALVLLIDPSGTDWLDAQRINDVIERPSGGRVHIDQRLPLVVGFLVFIQDSFHAGAKSGSIFLLGRRTVWSEKAEVSFFGATSRWLSADRLDNLQPAQPFLQQPGLPAVAAFVRRTAAKSDERRLRSAVQLAERRPRRNALSGHVPLRAKCWRLRTNWRSPPHRPLQHSPVPEHRTLAGYRPRATCREPAA
jgi:hypothetical protein